jgi:tripartite-type tricarboxylate transporter receptor subunit TctC
VAEKLRTADLQASPNTPEQFAAFFREQSEKWQRFVREVNIKLD